MATYLPPKRGVELIFYVGLVSQTDTKTLQANPTLAAGDVKVSKDGGAFANLNTLPAVTPAAGKAVKVTLSATEMEADNLTVVFSDASGAEWCDQFVHIATAARQVDDLTFPNTSGRGMDVDASGGVEVGSFQAGAITAATFAAGAIDSAAIAAGAIGSSELADGAITAAKIATDAIDADALATDAVTEIATGMLDLAAGVETGLTLRQAMRLIAAASAGKLSGAATTTITIRNAVADSKDRITATVDSSGNRSAITVDLT